MIRINFRIVCAFLMLLAFGSSLFAQTSKGFVVGSIADPNGALIVGANVRITNVSTGVSRETVSADDGSFRIEAVDPGTYRVEVSQSGFKTATRDNVIVTASQTTAVQFQLDSQTSWLGVRSAMALGVTSTALITIRPWTAGTAQAGRRHQDFYLVSHLFITVARGITE